MTSLIRQNCLRFLVEPESIPNIPNVVGTEQIIVGENASIAIEVLGGKGRDVWIFSVTCLQENGNEHPSVKVIKVRKKLHCLCLLSTLFHSMIRDLLRLKDL